MKYNRKNYLNRDCSYREYYGQFVTTEIKEIIKRRLSLDKLLSFEDVDNMSDVKIERWDAIAHAFPVSYKRKLRDAGDSYSKAGAVSIAKEAARQLIEDHIRETFWDNYPELKEEYFKPGKAQNDYKAEVRETFVNFIDSQNKNGKMRDSIAEFITL